MTLSLLVILPFAGFCQMLLSEHFDSQDKVGYQTSTEVRSNGKQLEVHDKFSTLRSISSRERALKHTSCKRD
jgi:hypothetical protein